MSGAMTRSLGHIKQDRFCVSFPFLVFSSLNKIVETSRKSGSAMVVVLVVDGGEHTRHRPKDCVHLGRYSYYIFTHSGSSGGRARFFSLSFFFVDGHFSRSFFSSASNRMIRRKRRKFM